MRTQSFLWMVLALMLMLIEGCATQGTMKRIKGYTKDTKVDGHLEKEKIAPQPGYYAVLPFAALYDAVAVPIGTVYVTLGVWTGLLKPWEKPDK